MLKQLYKTLLPEKTRLSLRYFLFKIRGLFYIGNDYYCNICERSFRTLLEAGVGARKRTLAKCPHCNSLERHRLMWLFLKEEIQIERQTWQVIHFAPEPGLVHQLKKIPSINYVTADRFSSMGELKIDLTNNQLASDHYDFIICSHVLGHIEHEDKAISELYRILKPGGQLLLLTYIDWEQTTRTLDLGMNENERVQFYNQDQPLRIHGHDFSHHLSQFHFSVETIFYAEKFPELKIRLSLPDKEALFLCTK